MNDTNRFHVVRNGVTIDVHARGSGSRIVLIPSLGRGAEDFDAVATFLAAQGFRTLAPEPRGFGASTGLAAGMTLHDLARDIARVIEHEANGPVVVVGHAFGNWVARTLATDRPDLVRAVVLLAAGKKGATEPAVLQAIRTSYEARASLEERRAALRLAFFSPGSDERVWLEGWHAVAARLQLDAARAVPQDDIWQAGGVVPVLEVQAADDALLKPPYQTELRELLGADRVTTVRIECAGHALLPEQPRAVARAIVEFCAAIGFR